MARIFLLAWFLGLNVISQAWAEETLAVPSAGAIKILALPSLTEIRSLPLSAKVSPKLASHPSARVLAGLVGEELVFWNLPSYSEASRHRQENFRAVEDMEFSEDGGKLFLLSPKLRTVLVFSLSTSRVEAALPIPGGDPLAMKVTPSGILVRQANGAVLLSTTLEPGLLAQFRAPTSLLACVAGREQIFMAWQQFPGVDRYELKTGQALAPLFLESNLDNLALWTSGQGLLTLDSANSLRAQKLGGAQPAWILPLGSDDLQGLLVGPSSDKAVLYQKDSGLLVVVDITQGVELSRSKLVSGLGAAPVFCSDN